MRRFLLLVPLMISSPLWAHTKTLVEVSFKDSSKFHRFRLIEESKKPGYKLLFLDGKSQAKVKNVSKSQSDLLRRQIRRIIWQAQYRKPASVKSCSKYVSLMSGGEKADVCMEDRQATARSYGLLNALGRIFH